MDDDLKAQVRDRAEYRCEHCRIPQRYFYQIFHIEHIIAKSHGGDDDPDNLALACRLCNLHKAPNLSGIDPEGGQLRGERGHPHFAIDRCACKASRVGNGRFFREGRRRRRLLHTGGNYAKGENTHLGTRMAGRLCGKKAERGKRKAENTGFGRGGAGDFATGGFAEWELCNARGEVGFLHNSPRWWINGVAKVERGKRKADEETREMGARGLLIERHPALQKGAELCEKTTKTPFWRQKAIRQKAEVVEGKEVAELRRPNYAKIGRVDLQKEAAGRCGDSPLNRAVEVALKFWRKPREWRVSPR